MDGFQISIANCNNIESGVIEIQPNRLNIKYAINGTGKSTIAQALACKQESDLMTLLPFKYHGESPLEAVHEPALHCLQMPASTMIFNEQSVRDYLFQPNDLIENSFEVLLKTADYEARMREIEVLIHAIRTAFQENPVLDELSSQLAVFLDGCKTTKTGLSKAAKMYKGFGQAEKLEHIPEDLKEYEPFLKSEHNVKWLTWQAQGNNYLDTTDKCPYCIAEVKPEKTHTIRRVSEEYESKQVEHFLSIASLFEELKPFLINETALLLDELLHGKTEFTVEQEGFLLRLKDQVQILYDKLQQARYISFGALKDVDKVIEELNKKKIDLSYLNDLNSPLTNEKVRIINDSLDTIISKAGVLQGEINKQKRYIAETIDAHKKNINHFLENAGYKYQVDILPDGDEGYRLVLKHIACEQPLTTVDNQLSFGEKNAFALVLFMYKALKESPELIILDDPISSFDSNKKYAIIDMLFRRQNSFQGKTVLMLTHDFEPIIDMTHTLRHHFEPLPMAAFLCNKNGVLSETPIDKTDILSIIDVTRTNVRNASNKIIKLIYLRRLLEMENDKNLAWQLLSNIFHTGREAPIYQELTNRFVRDMTPDEIVSAEGIVSMEIPAFSYATTYAEVQNIPQMILLYRSCNSGYEKLQLYRMLLHDTLQKHNPVFQKFINETYHIENDFLYQLNPQKYELIPQHIIEFCDNEIDLLSVNHTM